MRISEVHVYQHDLPVADGSYRMASTEVTRLDTTIVEILTDTGIAGYGETCPVGPVYQPHHALGARAALEEIGPHLRNYNIKKLIDFFSGQNVEVIEKYLSTFTKDINHFINVIASSYSPILIIIMQHTDDYRNYRKLFEYINSLLSPSEEIMEKAQGLSDELKAKSDSIKKGN